MFLVTPAACRLWFAALLSLFLTGCGPDPSARTYAPEEEEPFPLRVQLDWFPEPQHGGLYQALAKGYFAEEGLSVKLAPGGPGVLVTEFVGTGDFDIGQSASSQVMRAAARGVPVINVASAFHHLPSALLMRADNPVDSFEDLDGRTIIGRPEAVYIPFIRRKFGIDFEVQAQTFDLTRFLVDPDTIQEGYYIAETWFIRRAGVEPKWLALSESGYDPYATLFANTDFAREHPEALRAFLRAYVRGYRDYIEGDPAPAHALIAKGNPRATPEFLEYSRRLIIENRLARGDPAAGESYGTMEPARYARTIRQLEEIGILQPGEMTVERAMTTQFLP